MNREWGDPKLSWLEAFAATAKHLDFQLAAEELGVGASIAQRRVEKLEVWLHRLLILDDGPLEVYAVDGVRFLEVTTRVLRDFQSFATLAGVTDLALSSRHSAMSTIRLSELESLLSLAAHRNYNAAAYGSKCSPDQVRRNVRKLEDVFGLKLVAGRSQIELTDLGRQFVVVANDTLTALLGSVADISGYDPIMQELAIVRRAYTSRRVELTLIISRAERKRKPSKRHIIEAHAAREQLASIDESLNAVRRLMIGAGDRTE